MVRILCRSSEVWEKDKWMKFFKIGIFKKISKGFNKSSNRLHQ